MPQKATSVIIPKNSSILLVSRKDNLSDFGLPGGKVEPKDGSIRDAAKREVIEETGLRVFDLEEVYNAPCRGNHNHTFIAHELRGTIDHDREPGKVIWASPEVPQRDNMTFSYYNSDLFSSILQRDD